MEAEAVTIPDEGSFLMWECEWVSALAADKAAVSAARMASATMSFFLLIKELADTELLEAEWFEAAAAAAIEAMLLLWDEVA